jgi:hypothetical protein
MKKFPALRGFPKISGFGKAVLDLGEKTGFGPFSPKPFPKLTKFWERPLILAFALVSSTIFAAPGGAIGHAAIGKILKQ